MTAPKILVTGATGAVGSAVVHQLRQHGQPVRAAVRDTASASDLAGGLTELVALDFLRPETWPAALEGIEKIFLVRPPAISNTRRHINPFIDAAKRAGVRHVVLLSLLGAERNAIVPHRRIEKYLEASGITYTFLRASFFMQNLSATHGQEIRETGTIAVPAGNGTTSFIDARDIGEVAARVLMEAGHENRAYDLTGSEALTYGQVANILTDVLDREIAYVPPSVPSFVRRTLLQGHPLGYALVTAAIYTTARLGLAGRVTPDTARLLEKPPTTLREFAADYADCWR